MAIPSVAPTHSDPRWGSEDRPRKAEAIWQTLLHHCGPGIANGRWIDIGCGSGGIAAYLAPRVGEMIGIDPEPWARWADWTRDHANLSFLCGSYDSEPAPIPAGTADVVICNQVYEHVPDPVALIQFIHQSLKRGGRCYFAGPNLLFPIEPHVHLPFIHWTPRRLAHWALSAVGSQRIANLDANSVHYWRLRSWLSPHFRLIDATPYVVRSVSPTGPRKLLWRIASRLPEQVLHAITPLAPGFVFILVKE